MVSPGRHIKMRNDMYKTRPMVMSGCSRLNVQTTSKNVRWSFWGVPGNVNTKCQRVLNKFKKYLKDMFGTFKTIWRHSFDIFAGTPPERPWTFCDTCWTFCWEHPKITKGQFCFTFLDRLLNMSLGTHRNDHRIVF